MSSGLYQIRDKDLDTTLDLTRLKPYGDTMNDGKVQTSFTLPVKDDDRGAAAAVLIAQKMGLADPNVALRQKLDENFTFYVVYGATTHSVNYNEIEVLTVADENGGRLKNRVVFFADELGTCPPIRVPLPPATSIRYLFLSVMLFIFIAAAAAPAEIRIKLWIIPEDAGEGDGFSEITVNLRENFSNFESCLT